MKVAGLWMQNTIREYKLPMTQACNRYIRRSLDMARRLTLLADQMDARCDDDGCAVMSGVVRDCAYKIRGRAELEKQERKIKGLWGGD
jgi:hypothetical protein